VRGPDNLFHWWFKLMKKPPKKPSTKAPEKARLKLAVMGAGQIGRRHIAHLSSLLEAECAAVIDPSPSGADWAAQHQWRWFPTLKAMCAELTVDGVIIATPNQLHVENGLEVVRAGLPALVEKPIADDVTSAITLVEAAEAAGVPLLVGHHRRHNPMIQAAKAVVESGRLGKIASVHGFFWLMKPDSYFDIAWRREAGAGPVLTNLIHDIDLLRYLCGEVEMVQALTSNAMRGHAIEETAVVLLRFANGALGTINVSDSIVAPWSWEHTTGENIAYPRTDQSCYMIGGTLGSLTVPKLEVWHDNGRRDWWQPLESSRVFAPDQDPLPLQIQQFCRVIRGEEAPLVSGREGLQTLKVIAAIQMAAKTGRQVTI
jgi:predicted dehydrogenase